MIDQYTNEDLETYFTDHEKHIARIDLHNTQGNSDKVYIICVAHHIASNTFHVFSLYGRRGNQLAQSDQGTYAIENDAMSRANEVKNSKLKKGYQFVGQTLANASATTSRPVLNGKAALMNFNPGPIRVVDKHSVTFMRIVENDECIIEPVQGYHDNPPVYFVMYDCSPQYSPFGWHIFDSRDYTCVHIEEEVPDNKQAEIQMRGTVFMAYRTGGDQLALFDIYYNGATQREVWHLPWKMRRAMLTAAYQELFPKRKDPYDTSYYCHLNDYIYEDKLKHITTYKGDFVARGINIGANAESHLISY